MKIDVSKFDNVEDFCKTFSYTHGCLMLSMLYKDWTDYFCSTFPKQYVLDCCENYNSDDCNKCLVVLIENLCEEEDYHDCGLDED